MNVFNTITQAMYAVLAVIVIAAIIIAVIIIKIMKKASLDASKENDAVSPKLKKEDITSYISFDDIKDGIIVLNNFKKFVAGIQIGGIDLYNASPDEQYTVMLHYTQLFDMLPDEEYMQMRHEPVLRDLSSYTETYRGLYDSVSEDIYNKLETKAILEKKVTKLKKKDGNNQEITLYLNRICDIQKELESLNSQKMELDQLIRYNNANSGMDSEPDMRSTYLVSWEYKPEQHMFDKDKSKEAVFDKAKLELASIIDTYCGALIEAGLHAKMIASTEQMTDIFRRYFRPVTGGNFLVADIMRGSIMDEVTQSERDMRDYPKRRSLEAARLSEAQSRIVNERREREVFENENR